MINVESKDSLPAIPVENLVVWSNPNMRLSKRLQIGQPTEFGLFLINSDPSNETASHLQVEFSQHRVGGLAMGPVEDKAGNRYFEFDLKGCGYISRPRAHGELGLRVFPIGPRGEEDSWGLWDIKKALREVQITEAAITRMRARTYRLGAVIQLHEIALPDGKKVTVEEAKRLGLLHDQETPVLGLRAYRCRTRIKHDPLKSPENFFRAKAIVQKELNKEFGWEDYLYWFADTLGLNLARIHESGYWHGWVSENNVTLACEVVDFGFGEGSKKLADLRDGQRRQAVQSDFYRARDTLDVLARQLVGLDLIKPAKGTFLNPPVLYEKSYRSVRQLV